MQGNTEQIKILEEIEDDQKQDLPTAIQLIFYLNPLFSRRMGVNKLLMVKKPCFDLMEFEDEEFFEKRDVK